MLKTIKAIVEKDGRIWTLEPLKLERPQRALVTILDEEYEPDVSETALMSEAALAHDWNREEEDEAWQHLQQE